METGYFSNGKTLKATYQQHLFLYCQNNWQRAKMAANEIEVMKYKQYIIGITRKVVESNLKTNLFTKRKGSKKGDKIELLQKQKEKMEHNYYC